MDRNISLEAFEKKFEEASVDGEHNVISKADHIEDLESSVDETGEVAKINPKTEIKDNEGNVIN